ncbi:ribonuclease E/G [Alphaproteobacteria bacterium]|nr:ribonuclease E/G [Alphaproteobacteria bacterium]
MIDKVYKHFILIDKCADETRIVEILDKKIVKFISWFGNNIPLIGNIYDAIIIKKLNGGIARAKIKNKTIVTVRGVPKTIKINCKIKIIITSEKFDEKPVQAKILFSNSEYYSKLVNLDHLEKIIYLHFSKDIPVVKDEHAIYWEFLELDNYFLKALEPKVELDEGGIIWIEKTKAATLIDIDTGKLKLNLNLDMLAFCKKIFFRCIQEIKLRNIGGMILIDFPRMPYACKKELHQYIIDIGKNHFIDGTFLGFSKLLLYEIYIPRSIALLESFYKNMDEYNFQNHLRSLWRKSIEVKSKNNIDFLCGSNLYKKIKNKKTPAFINVVQRTDLPEDYGELMEIKK